MRERSIMHRFKDAFSTFVSGNKHLVDRGFYMGTTSRPDRNPFSRKAERSIASAIYNRIAIDVAAMDFKHIRVDEENRYRELMNSGLNNCLSLEANIDQTGSAFIQDVVASMLDEGCVAVVPTMIDDSEESLYLPNASSIKKLRVGKIIQWFPESVLISVYNESTGNKDNIRMPKKCVALIENPFYAIMNEPNSTMQRLTRKLSLLDSIDEQSGSGKMDLIIQLPYELRSEVKQQQAEARRTAIEDQLKNSKYGIAYISAAEHVIQLNRSVDNNLMSQIEYLTNMVYSQLSMPKTVLDGTADENVMNTYLKNTIRPIASAIVEEFNRKFLTQTARSQKQTIRAFSNPFEVVPPNQIAELSDKLTRNEILTSNEVRQILGLLPSDDPNANELRNKNLNQQGPKMQASSESKQEDDASNLFK